MHAYTKRLRERHAPAVADFPPVMPHTFPYWHRDRLDRDGGVVVVAEHPYQPLWAWTAPEVLAIVRERGTLAARFDGIDPAVPPADVLYEPLDADFLPLRGFAHVRAPGPNIAVWWVAKGSRGAR